MRLYTAQSRVVLDTLEKTGSYIVKREYIISKYGEAAGVMLKAYDWFKLKFDKRVRKPEYADYPVWLFKDYDYAKANYGEFMLELEVPEEYLVLFDNKGWEKVLSMDYVPVDAEDEKRFDKELEGMGIDCGYTVFEKPHYPMLRSRIKKSWDRIFDCKSDVLRAATWEIRAEWII